MVDLGGVVMSEDAIKLAPPFEIALSDNVNGRYGYKDAHVDMTLKLPAPISTIKESFTQPFEDEYVRALAKTLDDAALLAEMPEEERARVETPVTVKLGGPVSGRYGYDDGHLELDVALPWIFRPVMPSGVHTEHFPAEEAKSVREALKPILLWSDLPEDERARIGA